YAIAYDVLGQSARTQTVRVGQIEDTVAPKLEQLSPAPSEILTTGDTLALKVGVTDIGSDAARSVDMSLTRAAESNRAAAGRRTGQARARRRCERSQESLPDLPRSVRQQQRAQARG